MNIRRLQYFVAVAEELHFTRVAERLHVAQPPLSTQIRFLEEDLGTPLFTRDKKRVFLTSAGEELLTHTREILHSVEAARKATRGAGEGLTIPKGHFLAARQGISIAGLRGEALITYPRDAGIGLYWPILRLFPRMGFKPRIVGEAREPALMIGLVAAGSGIAIVPYDTQSIKLEGVAKSDYWVLADEMEK